jgi:hypothetical protein
MNLSLDTMLPGDRITDEILWPDALAPGDYTLSIREDGSGPGCPRCRRSRGPDPRGAGGCADPSTASARVKPPVRCADGRAIVAAADTSAYAAKRAAQDSLQRARTLQNERP